MESGQWFITNLGAILFAKRLEDFRTLSRKAVRVVQYQGDGRIQTLKEQVSGKGYACGFESVISYINALLPANEVIGQAFVKSEAAGLIKWYSPPKRINCRHRCLRSVEIQPGRHCLRIARCRKWTKRIGFGLVVYTPVCAMCNAAL